VQHSKHKRTCLPKACAIACISLLGTQVSAQQSDSSGGGFQSLLEEVVVTARKREESLQDAPLAVSAFSGEA